MTLRNRTIYRYDDPLSNKLLSELHHDTAEIHPKLSQNLDESNDFFLRRVVDNLLQISSLCVISNRADRQVIMACRNVSKRKWNFGSVVRPLRPSMQFVDFAVTISSTKEKIVERTLWPVQVSLFEDYHGINIE